MAHLSQPQSKHEKFDSFYGFSLDAAENGDKIRVAFRANCHNKLFEDGQIRLISTILDSYAYPEVIRRLKDGTISPHFRLRHVHLVMFRDTNRNEILLNEDVKFMANVKYKDAKEFKAGEIVMAEDMDNIIGLYPDSTNDPNAAHIMLTKFNGNWYYACDLIYDLEVSTELCEKADTWLNSASKNMDNKRWMLFLDKLLNIFMVSTQAIHLLQYNKYFSLRLNHQKTFDFLLAYAKNGNIDLKYSDLYSRLIELRTKVGELNEVEARNLHGLTSDFLGYVKTMLTSLIQSRMPPLNYIKFHGPIGKTEVQQTKLVSFGAIAAENASAEDETVKLIFQVNCKDNFLKSVRGRMVFNILDNYAYPEVMRLVDNGTLLSDFKLQKVHLVMYADQRRNEILLNDNVRAISNTKFKSGRNFHRRQPITEGDIEDILGLYPSAANDKNAAHVILMRWGGTWYCAFDLIYDRKRTGSRLELAKSYLTTAIICLEQKLWGPFVDNLYSATELAIQSVLLLHHNPKYSLNQSHEDTRRLFSDHANGGNIDIKYSDHYVKLNELRDKGRYLNGMHGKDFILGHVEANELAGITEELTTYVEKLMVSIDLSKRPPDGEYCSLGRH